MAGAAKDLIDYAFNHTTFTEQDVIWIADLVAETDSTLLSFWVLGQPDPDRAWGSMHVHDKHVGTVAKRFQEARNPAFATKISRIAHSAQIEFYGPPVPYAWGPGQPSLQALADRDSDSNSRE